MGNRSTGKTLATIFVALLERRTWSQADLARRCGVGVPAIRTRLAELVDAGVPLECESDPPHVYWSVPRSWFPNGRVVESKDLALVARLLRRLQPTKEVVRALRAMAGQERQPADREHTERYPEVLGALEDAARDRRVATIDYYTTSRGDRSSRDVSIHRVLHGDRVRILATCHRSGTLKFFRVDEISRASVIESSRAREVTVDEVNAFLATSVDGYRAPREAILCSFAVRFPEGRWVQRNLPRGAFEAEHLPDCIRFTIRTAGLEPLARFVVGLGAAAKSETPELQVAVHELALGALQQMRPLRKVNNKSVRAKRATN